MVFMHYPLCQAQIMPERRYRNLATEIKAAHISDSPHRRLLFNNSDIKIVHVLKLNSKRFVTTKNRIWYATKESYSMKLYLKNL